MNLDSWCRIGPDERRSLWSRVNPKPEAVESGMFIAGVDTVESIELCAGREGDDAYVRIDASNPQFRELLNIVTCAEYAVEVANGGV